MDARTTLHDCWQVLADMIAAGADGRWSAGLPHCGLAWRAALLRASTVPMGSSPPTSYMD